MERPTAANGCGVVRGWEGIGEVKQLECDFRWITLLEKLNDDGWKGKGNQFLTRIFLKKNVSFKKKKFLPDLHVPHMLFSKRMEAPDM